MRTLLAILFAAIAIVLVRWSFYTVDAGEYAYVTLLGRPIATWDGADPNEAGLHVGWPWPVQAVQRLEGHISYSFTNRLWASLDTRYFRD